jgi:DnaJ-class molecular chaperone
MFHAQGPVVRRHRSTSLQVTTQPGEVIKPDSWKVVDQEGMPLEANPYEKGNLYIQFDVKFPDSLTPQQVEALTQVPLALQNCSSA